MTTAQAMDDTGALTTVAAIKKMVRDGKLGAGERVLANITGSDRDPAIHPRHYTRVVRDGDGRWQIAGKA